MTETFDQWRHAKYNQPGGTMTAPYETVDVRGGTVEVVAGRPGINPITLILSHPDPASPPGEPSTVDITFALTAGEARRIAYLLAEAAEYDLEASRSGV